MEAAEYSPSGILIDTSTGTSTIAISLRMRTYWSKSVPLIANPTLILTDEPTITFSNALTTSVLFDTFSSTVKLAFV